MTKSDLGSPHVLTAINAMINFSTDLNRNNKGQMRLFLKSEPAGRLLSDMTKRRKIDFLDLSLCILVPN